MKAAKSVAPFLILLGLPVAADGQVHAPPPPPGADTAQVQAYQARGFDDMQLRNYTWTTRAELLKKGVLVDQIISEQSFLPNGRQQRVVLNDGHMALPPKFQHGAAAAQKLENAQDYLSDLRDRVELYRPTAGALMNFLSASKLTGPDANGWLVASGKNVVKNGDTVTLWLDAATKHMRRLKVSTIFQDDPVELSATFATLPDVGPYPGPTYMEFAEVNVPAKQATLLLHSYNFVRTGK